MDGGSDNVCRPIQYDLGDRQKNIGDYLDEHPVTGLLPFSFSRPSLRFAALW
jgi:hypothetical protein